MYLITSQQPGHYGKGKCPKCGALLSDGDSRCPLCYKRRSGRPVLLGLILAGALAVVLILRLLIA
jgi:predicted amidophosphoribosyltransferase